MDAQKKIRTPASLSISSSHGEAKPSLVQAVQDVPSRLTSTLSRVPRPRPDRVAVDVEEDFKIIWLARPIPIERTLNGQNLILHLARTAVVLTPTQARRLAYSLLLEAKMTGATRRVPSE